MGKVAPGGLAWKVARARKFLRPSRTQNELADRLGVSRSLIGMIERGDREPQSELVRLIAQVGGYPVEWFYDAQPTDPPSSSDGFPPPPPSDAAYRRAEPRVGRRAFPVLGTVGAAAIPMRSEDPWPGDYVEFSDDLFRPDRFAIQVRGDSMRPRLRHGDYVLVQPSVEIPRGLVAIAKNEVHEYTAKVLSLRQGRLVLEPVNPDYDPIVPGDGWELVGYAVGLRRDRGPGRYVEEGDNAGLRPDEEG